jgi:hypothetical protein
MQLAKDIIILGSSFEYKNAKTCELTPFEYGEIVRPLQIFQNFIKYTIIDKANIYIEIGHFIQE